MAARTATKKPRVRKTATKKRATPAEKSPTDQNTARMASPIPEMMEKPPETSPEMIPNNPENLGGGSQTGEEFSGFMGERGNLGAFENQSSTPEKPQQTEDDRNEPHKGTGSYTNTKFMGKREFHGLFKVAMLVPHKAVLLTKKVNLQTLVVSDDDPGARAASDALYEICYETSALHFAIESGTQFYQNVIIVISFVGGLALAGMAEYQEIQAAKKTIEGTATEVPEQKQETTPPPPTQPAGDNDQVYCDALSVGLSD